MKSACPKAVKLSNSNLNTKYYFKDPTIVYRPVHGGVIRNIEGF
jgi:hypothetical protein